MGNIVPFSPELAGHFRDLNLEWLRAYFYVEPHDNDLLNSCKELIIDKGGYIFFYKEKDEILGTYALIKLKPGAFELGKMAVRKKERGKGIGQQMLLSCISFARQNNWERIILYSNTSLANSIHIYKKHGFQEIPLEPDNPYQRGNIKMELLL